MTQAMFVREKSCEECRNDRWVRGEVSHVAETRRSGRYLDLTVPAYLV